MGWRIKIFEKKANKKTPTLQTVTEFEQRIAEFFGSPFAVCTDSCTHALELCLRHTKAWLIEVPRHTYLSVPMLAYKLRINLVWKSIDWSEYYHLTEDVIDAAVMWRRGAYKAGTFMCVSFQNQKHLSLGRGGVILCDNEEAANELRKMAYDGRSRETPWREQIITSIGYHYYLSPEIAALGLTKIDSAIETTPRKWSIHDWPDISINPVFKKQI